MLNKKRGIVFDSAGNRLLSSFLSFIYKTVQNVIDNYFTGCSGSNSS